MIDCWAQHHMPRAGETQQQADDRVAAQVMAICRALSATLGRLITPAPLNAIEDSEDRFEIL